MSRCPFVSWAVAALAVGVALTSPATAAQQLPTQSRFFSPPADDPALGVLREIFGNLVDYVAGNGTVADLANNDTVLGAGFAVFCTAVLTLGLLFVAYTSIVGVVNTAHDGEFLGKKMSSIWIPLERPWAARSCCRWPVDSACCRSS